MGGRYVSDGPSVPRLTVLTDDAASVVLEPDRDHIVGRDPACAVVVSDRRVSRRHAVLRVAEDGWELVDTGSVNGTYTGGRRVERVVVGDGAEVLLGDPVDGGRLTLLPEEAPAGPAGPVPGPVGPPPGPIGPVPAPPGPVGPRPPSHPGGAVPPGPPPGPRPPSGPGGAWRDLDGGAFADPRPSVDRRPSAVLRVPVRTMRIGRALDNDLVLTDLMVSRHHAELRTTADGGYEIVDLDSHNGTYVNGRPVTRHLVGPHDIVGIGHATFRLDGNELREFIDTGAVSLEVRGLQVRAGDKTLLHDVSFPIAERTLLAIVGTSGAGKSTLLKALTGSLPVSGGSVLYDGRDLFEQFAELRQRIGLVPQDDILHRQLTVRQALTYAARLRFPQDTDKAERARRVEEVIRDLGLEERAGLRVDKLSGGQRKRVSVAVELLTKPSLLFLDEPTSGLDVGSAGDLMDNLRTLADDGRTVITVLHDLESTTVCDRLLVLVTGGWVAYYGPPGEALDYFGKENWKLAFRMLNGEDGETLQRRFTASEAYRRYVETGRPSRPEPEHAPEAAPAAKPPKPQSWLSQFGTLSRRYLSVIASDKKYLGLLIAAPIFLGALCRAIPGQLVAEPGTNREGATKLLVLFVISGLMGSATAVNELIKERAIYQRERSAGLSVTAYLASKLFVLGAIAAIQGAALTAVALTGVEMPSRGVVLGDAMVEIGIAVVLASVASMALGLVISAVVGTPELTMPLLVVVAIIQVVLCGALFPLTGSAGIQQLSWIAPARWGFAAAAGTIDLLTQQTPKSNGGPTPDPLWKHDPRTWYINIALLGVQIAAYATLAMLMLRRLDPRARKRR